MLLIEDWHSKKMARFPDLYFNECHQAYGDRMIEEKRNQFIGVLEEIEDKQETRKGVEFVRLKISGLWFSLFDLVTDLNRLEKGKQYLVNYWVSESDFKRSYRNISSIAEAPENFYYTTFSKRLDEIMEELKEIKGLIK